MRDGGVGRIYQTYLTGSSENWFCGVNGITVDVTLGAVMQGCSNLDAKHKLRAAFDRWLVWAMAMPTADLKHPRLLDEIKRMAG
jgi:hypothetical protein